MRPKDAETLRKSRGICPHDLETPSIYLNMSHVSPPPGQVPDLLARRRGRGNAAAALGLDKSAASKRYTQALEGPKEILAALPGESREGSP